MKNYLERFVGNPHSFQRKIITIYLVLTIIPMLLIALIITGVYYQRILDSAYNILNENAQQHEIIVQERMENYENVMYELVADSEFINLAKMYNISDSVDELKIKKILSSGINTYDQIRAAVFLSDSGKYVSYSRWYGSQYDSIWSESKKRTEIYDEVNKNQALTFIATVNIGIEEVRDDQAILMGFPVRDLRTQEQSGVLIIALDDNCLLFNSESESFKRRNYINRRKELIMRKIHLRDKQKNILLSILAVIIACIFLFPLYWIIVNSFKIDSEIFSSVPTLWPKKFTITAYKDLIGNLSVTLKNSVIIALGSMILSLVLSVPAAYGLARYKVKGMKLFVLVFLVTQMLPASLVLTPLFLIFSKLGLLNSYLAPILSTATISIPFVVLMLRPGFLSMPKELEDAAKIDGCTSLGVFFRICIPISKPTVITAACFSFVFGWNDLVYSMTFNTKDTMRPMTSAIYTYMNQYGTKWNSIMAYGVLLILPCCII